MVNPSRKLLLLSKNFVPQVGGGVRRVHAMSQYLPEHGYRVHSIASGGAPDRIYTSSSDRLRKFAGQIKLGRVYRKTTRWLSIPDDGILDLPQLLLQTRKIDTDLILASGPPNSILLAAQALSRLLKKPWIADLRDPWIDHPLNAPPSALHANLQDYLEKSCLATADGIVVATQAMADAIADRVGRDIAVHPFFNGYDQTVVQTLTELPTEPITVGYFGSFYGPIDPEPLVRAVAGAKATLIHAGADYDQHLKTAAQKHGVAVESLGLLSPQESFKRMHQVNVLAMVLPDDPSWAYCRTQKLAEYLATGRPILGFMPKGEAASLIEKHNAGLTVSHGDTAAAVKAIHTLANRELGDRKSPTDLSWQHQVQGLASFLDTVT